MKKRVKEINERLEVLDELMDTERDRIWQPYTESGDVSLLEGIINQCDEMLPDEYEEYVRLIHERSLITPIKLEPLDDYGDLMTIKEWVDCVKCGGFIDYDGDGVYATETQKSNKFIKPSHVKRFPMRDKEFTHIVWYNR